MKKMQELRMTIIILLVGLFFISGCFFTGKHTIIFKTNGGSEITNISVKNGNKLEEPDTPKKDGYTFIGWYQDGKEYDFDSKVEEDIILVAKWQKDDVEEPVESEEETTTVITTEPTTEVITTFRRMGLTTTKRIKKTTTAKSTTTTTTTSIISTEVVETTTKPVVIPPSQDILEPDVPSITPPQEVTPIITGMRIEKNEKGYLFIFDKTTNENQIKSIISEEDYKKLLISDKTKWQISLSDGSVYAEDTKVMNEDEILLLDVLDRKIFYIFDGEKNYIIKLDETTNTWLIKYPTVSLGSGISLRYYETINEALNDAIEDDILTLLQDIEVETLSIMKPITIDGNHHTIKTESDYLFDIKGINTEEKSISIKNMTILMRSFIKFEENVKMKSLILDHVKGNYQDHLYKNENQIPIICVDTEFLGIL